MSRIDLTGLRADLPIGAMAAFGCLRVCQRIERLRESRLSWERSTGTFHAVLWTKAETSRLVSPRPVSGGGVPRWQSQTLSSTWMRRPRWWR